MVRNDIILILVCFIWRFRNNKRESEGEVERMSVFENYEQQFSTITADITARIGKIPNLTGSKLY